MLSWHLEQILAFWWLVALNHRVEAGNYHKACFIYGLALPQAHSNAFCTNCRDLMIFWNYHVHVYYFFFFAIEFLVSGSLEGNSVWKSISYWDGDLNNSSRAWSKMTLGLSWILLSSLAQSRFGLSHMKLATVWACLCEVQHVAVLFLQRKLRRTGKLAWWCFTFLD